MGLANKVTQTSNPVETSNFIDVLTGEELEFLFNIIKNSKFDGKDLELVYNLVLKLQNQYLSLKK
jgi:hypothetical protein